MANRYWVGGNANWDATVGTKWSTTSGGAGGSAVPLASDDVFLDNGAGTGNVTIAANVVCRSLNCTGYTGILTYDTNARTIGIGDGTAGASSVALTLVAGMTFTSLGANNIVNFISTNGTQQTIASGGKTLGAATINGAGSSYLLSDGLTTTGNVTITSGTFATGNQAISCAAFSYGNATTRTIALGSSAITLTATPGWTGTAVTNLTVSANTAVVTSAVTSSLISLLNKDWNGLSFVLTGAAGATVTTTGTTIGSLTRTGTATVTNTLIISGGDITCTGTIRLDGNSIINRLLVQSDTLATPRTITAATMSASTDNVDFTDITGAGAANWNLSAKIAGDALGNSGITFTTPVTRYSILAANGSWSDTARWSASSGGATGASFPICHDDVILDNNTASANRTITTDTARACKNFTSSAMTNFTINFVRPSSGFSLNFYGTADFTAVASFNTVNWTVTLNGRSSLNFTPPSVISSPAITISAPGGGYTLTRALIVSTASNFTLLAGSLDTAGYSVTAEIFNSATATYTRSVTLGASTINIGTVASATAGWNVNATNLTVSAASSTIVYTDASANNRIFAGGSFTYGTFTYTVAGSTGNLSITGSNTFSTFNFSDVTNARTLLFTAATTTTIGTAFNVSGTSGKLMTIGSVTAASHTIAMPTGISRDYLSISRSTLTGNSAYAGANSTDGGNNSTSPGWIFTAPPAGNTGGFFSLMQ